MTWVRLDDQFADHPKVVGLSANAFRLHVTAICYAARQETDGVIPRGAAFVLAARRYLIELTGAGLWEDHPSGFLIHDYLEYNPSADEVRSKRNIKAIAGAKGAASRWHRVGMSDGDGKTMPPLTPRPDPDPDPPAAAARDARARDGGATTAHQRAYAAWEQQAPGGLNPVTVAFLDELVEEGISGEWIEAACNVAKEAGGYKPPKFISRVIDRFKSQGTSEDKPKALPGGFVSGLAVTELPGVGNFDFEAADRARDEAEQRRKARAK